MRRVRVFSALGPRHAVTLELTAVVMGGVRDGASGIAAEIAARGNFAVMAGSYGWFT